MCLFTKAMTLRYLQAKICWKVTECYEKCHYIKNILQFSLSRWVKMDLLHYKLFQHTEVILSAILSNKWKSLLVLLFISLYRYTNLSNAWGCRWYCNETVWDDTFFVYMYCLMKMVKGFRAINLTYMITVNLFISRGKHYFKGEVTKYWARVDICKIWHSTQ